VCVTAVSQIGRQFKNAAFIIISITWLQFGSLAASLRDATATFIEDIAHVVPYSRVSVGKLMIV
jgi:hypothetical protein